MECQLEKRSRRPGKRSLQEGQKSSLVRQSAISILTTEGGNWRTRHLKMRSSYARLAVMRVTGRTQGLRSHPHELMNTRKIEVEPTEDGEKREPRKEESSTMKIEEVATVLKLISLAAVISIAEGREEKIEEKMK